MGMKKFLIAGDDADATSQLRAEGTTLRSPTLTVRVDPQSGAITELRHKQIPANLVNASPASSGLSGGPAPRGLNDYLYVPETLPTDTTIGTPMHNIILAESAELSGKPTRITVKENGPVLCSLLIEGPAPGARGWKREVRLIAGLDRVDILNVIDKEPVRTKESVHLAFPLAVDTDDPTVRMHLPWAVARVGEDQLQWANRNYFTVQRFMDVAGEKYGVTWATVDAPLTELNRVTADQPWLLSDYTGRAGADYTGRAGADDPDGTIYSWAMNNSWFTNYRADQEGPTVFRYSLRPYVGQYDGPAAMRFGMEQSRPLVVAGGGDTSRAGADEKETPAQEGPLMTVSPESVVVETLKPANDREGLIVRLFGAGSKDAQAKLTFPDGKSRKLWISNIAEERVTPVRGAIAVPANGMVTVRVEQ
jgi:hypothetical protein